MTLTKNNILWLIVILYAIAAMLTILFFNGTGDEGDSIQHYLFARYAGVHPELFFNHWAKPVYVLLAFPFAQMGFTGIKIFNVLMVLASIIITQKIAEKTGLINSWVAAMILMFIPAVYMNTFTGLTEPLFALFSIVGIYLCIQNRLLAASIVISFIPFVRSEGWIILLVFALYFMIKKKWKMMLLLASGHIVYSLAGYFVHHDLLWVFAQNPYATLNSTYGKGSIFHFVFELFNATGVPIFLLFVTGLIIALVKSFQKKLIPEVYILILTGFGAYFIAHSLFWYFGIFNSMGLRRVLTAIFPLVAIISLYGFHFLTEELLKNKIVIKKSVQFILIAYIIIFPFTANPAAIQWKNMRLNENQQTAFKVGKFISESSLHPGRFYYELPYLNLVLGLDPFNAEKRLNLTMETLSLLKPGDIVIWDHWFAPEERGVTKQYLDTLQGLTLLQSFPSVKNPGTTEFAIYQVR